MALNAALRPGRRSTVSGTVLSLDHSSTADGAWVCGMLASGAGERLAFAGASLLRLRVGLRVTLAGALVPHPMFSRQLRVVECLSAQLPMTPDGAAGYLAANVAGCGDARARRIVSVLGSDCLQLLEADPEVARPLFTPRVANQICMALGVLQRERRRESAAHDLMARMLSTGLTAALARRILSFFRSPEVAEIILLRRPYRLLDVPEIGWKRADRAAQLLGVKPDDPERIIAAIGAALSAAKEEGHSALPCADLVKRAQALLRTASMPKVEGMLGEAEDRGILVNDGGLCYTPDALDTEWRIANALARLAAASRPLTGEQRAIVAPILDSASLSAAQRAAVLMGLECGVAVLCGGPGCGKTTAIRTYLRCCSALGMTVAIAAPTGKAASRAAEVTGFPAQTIHRLLGGPPGAERERPLDVDAVVLDEASMCSGEIAAWVLDSIAPARTRLLMVGDANQLPSVDHGAVLRDIIASAHVPVTELCEVFRQKRESQTISNARALLAGTPLALNVAGDFRFVDTALHCAMRRPDVPAAEGSAACASVLDEIMAVAAEHGNEVIEGLQVLTPTRRGPLGAEALNAVLQSALNPGGELGPRIGGDVQVRLGDRVMQMRNDYTACESGLFNGEQGVVSNIGHGTLTVSFGGSRAVQLTGVQLLNVRLAWAITVHRSQGSEWPYVFLVYDDMHGRMLDPQVLYTAMTRVQRRFTLVGTESAVATTLARHGAGALGRHTGLARQIATAVSHLK